MASPGSRGADDSSATRRTVVSRTPFCARRARLERDDARPSPPPRHDQRSPDRAVVDPALAGPARRGARGGGAAAGRRDLPRDPSAPPASTRPCATSWRESGLSTQAFYRHFRSKDELLVVLLDDGRRRIVDYLAHRMEKADEPAAQIRAYVEGVMAQATDREASARHPPVRRAAGPAGRALRRRAAAIRGVAGATARAAAAQAEVH